MKTKTIRKVLAALEPKKKRSSLAQIFAIREPVKDSSIESSFAKVTRYLLDKVKTNNLSIRKLENISTEKEVKLNKRLGAIAEDLGKLEGDLSVLPEILETEMDKFRSDVLSKLDHGGGSMNQRIQVNGTTMSQKYADFNLKAGANSSITAADNNTTKQVDITFVGTDTDTGITQLTGDVTAGPGSGSQVATLASVITAGGPIGSATVAPIITYDAKGRLTTVTSATITPAASSITGAGDLTKVDDTNVTLTLGGTPVGSLLKAVSLTLGWTGTLANARLTNSSLTVGSTTISLGGTSTTLAGLTSVTSTTFVGALTGNASTATNVAVGGITGLGTGVATALAVNTGTAGAFVVNGGALGTPSSGVVTNLTGTAGINITGTAPAGTLTGTTLNSTVVTSSLTTIGTLAAGAVPASLVTAGTFGGSTAYLFPTSVGAGGTNANPIGYSRGLTVTGSTDAGVQIVGTKNGSDGSFLGIEFVNLVSGTYNRIARIEANRSGANDGGLLNFFTASAGAPAVRMTIDKDGNVGIGDQTPDYLLDVAGTLGVDSTAVIGSTLTVGAADYPVQIGRVSNQTAGGVISFNGDLSTTGLLGIRSNGSGATGDLTFNSPTGLGGLFRINNSTLASYNSTDFNIAIKLFLTGLTADTGTTDNSLCLKSSTKEVLTGTGTLGICLGTSSERYKDNIDDLQVGLKEIMELRPAEFFYKEGYGNGGIKKNYGLIAEEMYKVLPDLVGLDEKEQPNTSDLLGLVPVLIKAVQEQQMIIDVLTTRLNNLNV